MSTPALELADPASAFFAAGNPEAFLTDNLPGRAPEDDDPAENHDTRNAAVAIAGVFLAWRYYVAHQLHAEPPPTDARSVLARFWARHKPVWLRIASPVLVDVYRRLGPLAQEELEAVAADYAASLGAYVHETSSQALAEGYHIELAKGTSPTLAWMRAIEGYGLDARRLRGWLAGVSADKTVPEDLISPGGRRALDRALLMRAEVLGEAEAWHARNVAKSVVWLTAAVDGLLPKGTLKRWITADDELVCPVCGPLHMVMVPVDERWELPDGREIWAPGVHPNCRCEMRLVTPERVPDLPGFTVEKRLVAITKAMGDDPYDRDRYGKFSVREARSKQSKPARSFARTGAPVRERRSDPVITRLLSGVETGTVPSLLTGEAPSLLTDAVPSLLVGAPSLLPEAPSLLPEVPSLLSSPSLLRRGRRLIILVKGKPVEVEVTEDGLVDETFTVDHGRLAVLPADDYFASWEANQNQPEAPDNEHLATGHIIDFNEAGVQLSVAGSAPVAFEGMVVNTSYGLGVPHFDSVLESISDMYAEADRQVQEFDERDNALGQYQYEFASEIADDPDAYIGDFTDEEIEMVLHQAGLTEMVVNETPHHQREYVIERAADMDHPIHEIVVEYLLEHDPPDNVREELAFIQSIVGADYYRSPQIFTFPKGFHGGWTGDGTVPIITGKYQVVRVIPHSLTGPEGTATPTHRIKTWREVVLEPIALTADDLGVYSPPGGPDDLRKIEVT